MLQQHPLKPSGFRLVVHVITFTCLFCLTIGSPTSQATDHAALLDFRTGVSDDPSFVRSHWNDSLHFCLWPGVTCSRRRPRVTRLDLWGLSIRGSLPPSIGNLTFLRVLDVGNNSFTGAIPPEIGNLRRLNALLLDYNSFSGQLPENISGCSSLRVIQLGNNALVGEIPRGLAALSELLSFTVESNNLTGGFPDFFGNFSSLEYISTAYNHLGGTIPTSLGQLRKLRWLCLGLNSFSGTIPAGIFNITPLYHVEFAMNQLEGGLPQDLGNTLPYLSGLIVADNHLSGPVPRSIANATNLLSLDISINNFRSSLPDLKNLDRLQVLSVSDNHLGSGASGDMTFLNSLNSTVLERLLLDANNFGGGLPSSIWNLSPKLNYLSFRSNRLTGSIPPDIRNLRNLEQLFIGGNQLTGVLPKEIGNLHKLKILGALHTGLSGEIPSSIGNLTMLVQLSLGGNEFEGNIPASLGNCQNLISLDLSQNSLNGSIPSQVLSISSLASFLDLSRNKLSGAIPDEVGHLTNLGRLYVHDNRLSGQVPESIGHCTILEQLNMGNNLFEGNISSFLSTLKGLQYLDVSQNDFSGEIPKFLVNFQLTYLNLSYNHFEGEVPDQGVFFHSSAFSVMGNNKLCGGISELNLPDCHPKPKSGRQISLRVIIATACGITVLFMVLLMLVKCIWMRRYRKQDGKPLSGLLSVVVSFPQISYEDILRATEGLDRNNLIGTGGFGSVYKGILGKGYNAIAIKVLDLKIQAASKSFMAECEVLRNIRHRNLVKILTACSTIDFQGNDFKALVYEYMDNGSLDDWLHPKVLQNGVYQGTLSLAHRLNIATEVASAVEYLHHGCEPSIVHCDLKPSNVLLDAEMTAHVSDFGLARILSTTEVVVQVSSVGMRGTIGYSPPEYGMGSQVSREGDVYSYGILLLEMFTGKRPTDEMFEDNWNIRTYCEAALLEGAGKVADPAVLCDESGEGSTGLSPGKIEECLAKVFEVGIGCCQESQKERMDIREAADKLRSIKTWFADASI